MHERIASCVHASFLGEVRSLKPGNVSVYAAGHDMTVIDFERSAEVTTPIICNPELSFGKRILRAVEKTIEAVGCNTNLGMLLLFTPIIMAAEQSDNDHNELQQQVKKVLSKCNQQDAEDVFNAISKANPGGLGTQPEHDVNAEVDCSLLEAMQAASHFDNVALQYVNGFETIFREGIETVRGFVKRWNSVEWATVASYLEFMATLPDSHIQRKYGAELANKIKKDSRVVRDQFIKCDTPANGKSILLEFDKQLKQKKINPGTSADLTATSLLVYNLTLLQK
ncbi:MAG: triphosphoribosyl-dephospho-CoA synthase [Pseudomonadota bacterium]